MTALEDPRWLALSPARKEALLEEHRNANVEGVEWWDSVYEVFIEDCKEQGICTFRTAIYFSGFWSQGDGACFAGHVQDWPKFLTAFGRPELVALYRKCDDWLALTWDHRGHYYHENCTSFSSDLVVNNPYDAETEPLQHDAWALAYKDGSVIEELEDDFIEFVRNLMRGLYADLETEYDYLTSDELIANYLLDYCDEDLIEELETEDEAELQLEQ